MYYLNLHSDLIAKWSVTAFPSHVRVPDSLSRSLAISVLTHSRASITPGPILVLNLTKDSHTFWNPYLLRTVWLNMFEHQWSFLHTVGDAAWEVWLRAEPWIVWSTVKRSFWGEVRRWESWRPARSFWVVGLNMIPSLRAAPELGPEASLFTVTC